MFTNAVESCKSLPKYITQFQIFGAHKTIALKFLILMPQVFSHERGRLWASMDHLNRPLERIAVWSPFGSTRTIILIADLERPYRQLPSMWTLCLTLSKHFLRKKKRVLQLNNISYSGQDLDLAVTICFCNEVYSFTLFVFSLYCTVYLILLLMFLVSSIFAGMLRHHRGWRSIAKQERSRDEHCAPSMIRHPWLPSPQCLPTWPFWNLITSGWCKLWEFQCFSRPSSL